MSIHLTCIRFITVPNCTNFQRMMVHQQQNKVICACAPDDTCQRLWRLELKLFNLILFTLCICCHCVCDQWRRKQHKITECAEALKEKESERAQNTNKIIKLLSNCSISSVMVVSSFKLMEKQIHLRPRRAVLRLY